MVKTHEVEAASDTHSAIASFLVAEYYKFAYANGKFIIEVGNNEVEKDRFESFLTFFQATATDLEPETKVEEGPKS